MASMVMLGSSAAMAVPTLPDLVYGWFYGSIQEADEKPFLHPEQGEISAEQTLRETSADLYLKPEAGEKQAECLCR